MSVSEEKVLKIHQVLHGYSDGHRLLEASKSLPHEAERVLLVLSDMSGPSMVHGFENYLTAYPLLDAGVYAFAKTWYASEMSRPGCVWTHTLLVEYSDLAEIRDLSTLLGLFVRPEKLQSLPAYGSPILLRVPGTDGDDRRRDHAWEGIAVRTLAALYAWPEKPIYLPAERSDRYENIILAIWSQQWPELRKSFVFSTGSISNRMINGRAFDIQIVPLTALRQLRRDVPQGEFVEVDTGMDSSSLPSWAPTAAAALIPEARAPVGEFLWRFGPETSGGRAAFAALMDIFTSLEAVRLRKGFLPELTKKVSVHFPEPTEASSLKAAIFGNDLYGHGRLLPEVPEVDLLRELTTSARHSAFNRKALGIRHRAKVLWQADREEAVRLMLELVNADLNPVGEEFLTGISEGIDVTDVHEFLKRQPDTLYVLVGRNPALAASPQLWRGSVSEQRQLLDAIAAYGEIPWANLKPIIAAMLAAGVDSIADEVLERMGSGALTAVLECFDEGASTSFRDLTPGWRRALASRPSGLLNWLQGAEGPHDLTLALAASLLDPHSEEVRSFGTAIWLRLLATAPANLGRERLVKTMAFLLALGFNNPGPGAAELVARAFEIVHDAAEKDELDYDSWRLLRDQLPSLAWWWDWDKCERLRRALVDRFIQYEWPSDQFLRSVKREDTFRRVVDLCKVTRRGRMFLQKIIKEAADAEMPATDAQRRILYY